MEMDDILNNLTKYVRNNDLGEVNDNRLETLVTRLINVNFQNELVLQTLFDMPDLRVYFSFRSLNYAVIFLRNDRNGHIEELHLRYTLSRSINFATMQLNDNLGEFEFETHYDLTCRPHIIMQRFRQLNPQLDPTGINIAYFNEIANEVILEANRSLGSIYSGFRKFKYKIQGRK